MKIPAIAMSGNLMWTRSGVVWATWRLQGLQDAYAGPSRKRMNRLNHQALFQAFRGDVLFLGLAAELDAGSVVEKMLKGIDLKDCPQWVEECQLTLDELEDSPLGSRGFWCAVPLPAASVSSQFRAFLQAAEVNIRESLALPVWRPTAAEISRAMGVAKSIEERIPGAFKPARVSPAEQVWISLHAQHRGLGLDESLPEVGSNAREASYQESTRHQRTHSAAAMSSPFLDEGGKTDLNSSVFKQADILRRRFLKVASSYSEAPSYQVMQALGSVPKSGWLSPGVEWVSRVDQFDLDIDWAMRCTISTAAEVKQKNKRAEANIADQFDQQEGALTITGGRSDLDETAVALAQFHEALNRSEQEVSVEGTLIIAVGGDTPEIAQARARYIADDYKGSEFILDTPVGGQEHLWWAMQPGIPTHKIVKDYAQLATSKEWATGMPLVQDEVGDQQGVLWAVNKTHGRRTPIFLDLEGTTEKNFSSSFGIAAELGAGKSATLKDTLGAVFDRQGTICGIDRTPAHEYAKFATSLVQEDSAVVDIVDPIYSLDPLRVFGPRVGAGMVKSLFSVMLGVNPMDDEGIELSALLAPEYVVQEGISSLPRLRTFLSDNSSTPSQQRLLRLINVVATTPYGKVLFDDSIPPLDLSKRAIIFLTAGIALPDADELIHKHLFEKLDLEKIFGRAMYALLAAIGRHVCFSDTTTFSIFFCDECHHITSSPEGAAEINRFLRDGRKHFAACGLASHDPTDFGDEKNRGLIKIRVVMRQSDPVLAERAAKWLMDEDVDPAVIEEIRSDLSPAGLDGKVIAGREGEGLLRDHRGVIGKFGKLLSRRPARRLSVLQTPGRAGMMQDQLIKGSQ